MQNTFRASASDWRPPSLAEGCLFSSLEKDKINWINYQVHTHKFHSKIQWLFQNVFDLIFEKFMALRPEQFNFLFFEPTELRFSKIEKKIEKIHLKTENKKRSWHIFSRLNIFFYLCILQDEICAFNIDQKPTLATAALGTHIWQSESSMEASYWLNKMCRK